jgi:hypothetical protein
MAASNSGGTCWTAGFMLCRVANESGGRSLRHRIVEGLVSFMEPGLLHLTSVPCLASRSTYSGPKAFQSAFRSRLLQNGAWWRKKLSAHPENRAGHKRGGAYETGVTSSPESMKLRRLFSTSAAMSARVSWVPLPKCGSRRQYLAVYSVRSFTSRRGERIIRASAVFKETRFSPEPQFSEKST